MLISILLLTTDLRSQQASLKDDTTTTKYYRVDSTLKSEIEQEISAWQEKNSSRKFTGGLMGVEVFVNDKESFSTVGKEKVEYFFPFLSVNEKDSIILIVGAFGTQHQSSGFEIYIKGTECLVLFVTKKDGEKIFRRGNGSYKSYVKTPTQYHLTLTKAPSFKKGEIIEGLVELRSYRYYEKGESGDDEKHTNIFANFKTPPLH